MLAQNTDLLRIAQFGQAARENYGIAIGGALEVPGAHALQRQRGAVMILQGHDEGVIVDRELELPRPISRFLNRKRDLVGANRCDIAVLSDD